jgi:hypothetical protein
MAMMGMLCSHLLLLGISNSISSMMNGLQALIYWKDCKSIKPPFYS